MHGEVAVRFAPSGHFRRNFRFARGSNAFPNPVQLQRLAKTAPSAPPLGRRLSDCAILDATCRRIEARRSRFPYVEAEAPEPDDCHDEGFLREHPAEQLLVPAVLLGTPVFTATPPTIPVPELVEHDLRRPAEGVDVRYCGPELRQSDLVLYGAIVAMNRGFKPTVAYRVNAETLFHITGVNPRQQHLSIRRLEQARVAVGGVGARGFSAATKFSCICCHIAKLACANSANTPT